MINLLPPDVKENIAYARRNIKLLRWSGAFGAGIVGALIIVVGGTFYIDQSAATYAEQLQKTQSELDSQKLTQTQKRVQDISSSLKLVVQVLSREVLFSSLIKQIGTAIPANASLTDLRISKVGGAIDLTAITNDYNTATQVQVNLQDPANKIFNKADIVNITCAGTGATDPRYPCTVNIRAQFAANNPFLFINKSGAKQ